MVAYGLTKFFIVKYGCILFPMNAYFELELHVIAYNCKWFPIGCMPYVICHMFLIVVVYSSILLLILEYCMQ